MLQSRRGQKRRFMAVFLCMAMVFTTLPQKAQAFIVETGEDSTLISTFQSEEENKAKDTAEEIGGSDSDEEQLTEADKEEEVYKEEVEEMTAIVAEADETESSVSPMEAVSTDKIFLADNLDTMEYKTTFESAGFTIKASEGKPVTVDASSKTAEDGTSFTKRLKLTGTGDGESRSIHFSTTAEAVVTVYAMSGSSGADRALDLYSLDGTILDSVAAYGKSLTVGTIHISGAGDYYLASSSSGVNVYGIKVTMSGDPEEVIRADWSTVLAPVITGVEQNGGKIMVTFELITGNDGADKATVLQMDEAGNTIDSVLVGKNASQTSRTAEFTPIKSGVYTFKVIAERTDETSIKESEVSETFTYVLPLEAPYIKGAYNTGEGNISIRFEAVAEAERYVVSYKTQEASDFTLGALVTDTEAVISGLTIGVTYIFTVKAMRGNEESAFNQISLAVAKEGERAWYFSAFGPGVNTDNNYYSKDEESGAVIVASESGKGKLQPPSTDGLAYYYTAINSESENFIMSGRVTVDSWTFSNGQEGFGLMAADAIGQNGDSSVFWNNSYMLGGMKVEYFWDVDQQAVSDSGNKIVMKQGIGAQEKTGVTAENIADGTIVTNINELFRSTLTTMDTSCALKGAGTYNIIGNFNNAQAPTGTVDAKELKTTFLFKLQRDNTGYRLSYTDENGNTSTKLFYDLDRNALTQIDTENIYVGFFASRNAKIVVNDIVLETSDPATDPPAKEQEITYVTPSYRVLSAKTSPVEEYELTFIANADGVLTVKDLKDKELVTQQPVTANTYVKNHVNLVNGTNTYKISFTPNEDYRPSQFERLSSYDTISFEHHVIYKNYNRTVLYVSPEGTTDGTGNESNPLDVYTAIQYAKPGQIILLKGGTYSLYKTLTLDRGINGTAEKMIYFIADERSTERPVFDFNSASAGMVIAGDYWYFKGFDVTKSADATKGIQLSGDNCIIDSVNTYYNGNTGLQISRYLSTDLYEDWPSDNLILNCTSYGNSDKGYEDADGFAAKLTVGDGNVFDGCIAYNNADDGWDLFAKLETGAIGQVVIKNCVAYGNGYLPDGTNAGNGNGFKLGGSSMTGYHKLINSVAYDNKAKGIDSNSCPDIKVYHCTTFNNESYNVAFYTNDSVNTDFFAEGVLSYRTKGNTISENIKPKGSQDTKKIYGTTNYYWDVVKEASVNSVNDTVSAEWFITMDTATPVTRNEDGTIQMNGLLALTDLAPLYTGARMSGTPSAGIKIPGENVTPTVTPVPTSAPDSNEVGSASTDAQKIRPELDNGRELKLTLTKGETGNTAWNEIVNFIKGKLKEYKIDNASASKEENIVYSITLNMNQETVIPKEFLETLQGKPVQVKLVLNNGMVWTINGNSIEKNEIKETDMAVQLNTGNIPEKTRQQFLQSLNQPLSAQVSLVHEGSFGFTAVLTIDFNKFLKGADGSSLWNFNKALVAGFYYYNPKSGEFTLQSAAKIGPEGKGNFTFYHASEYVIVMDTKLTLNEETLNQITVNKVTNGKTENSKLYLGGTTGRTNQLVINLPGEIKDLIEQDLIAYTAVYTSSDKSVATVSKDGLITAKGAGNAVITTKLTLNEVALEYKTLVTVKKAQITFVKGAENIEIKKQSTFEVKLFGYSEKDIVWMTSKKEIALVHKNYGKTKAVVYGISEGTEEVYIKLRNNSNSYIVAKSIITVTNPSKAKDADKVINKNKKTASDAGIKSSDMFYLVKSGDSLWKIAKKYGLKITDILDCNDIKNAELLQIGQKIKIPKK